METIHRPFIDSPATGQLVSPGPVFGDMNDISEFITNFQGPLRRAYDLGQRNVNQAAFNSMAAPRTAYEFIKATQANPRLTDSIVAVAIGLLDHELYVWLFLNEIDVALTREIFELKNHIEEKEFGQFELHVKPLQGRDVQLALPDGFELVTF